MKYTVLLAYPYNGASDAIGDNTYLAHVNAGNSDEAAKRAQQQASRANQRRIKPDEFESIAVFYGHQDYER